MTFYRTVMESAEVWRQRGSSVGCRAPAHPEPKWRRKAPGGEAAPNGTRPGGRIAGQLAHQVRPERESWRMEETLGLGPRDLGKYILKPRKRPLKVIYFTHDSPSIQSL